MIQPDLPPRPADPPLRLLWLLVGVMALIEGAFHLADLGLWDFDRREGYLHGAFFRQLLTEGLLPVYEAQPWAMFLTHAFLHSGWVHLLMNGAILLAIGRLSVMVAGEARTLLLFGLGAVGGGAGFALLGPDGPSVMVGASGAGFAFLAAWKRWEFDALRASGRSTMPVLQFVFVLTAVNVALHFLFGGMLAWEAHLGGAIVGGLLAPILARRRAR